MKDLVLFSDPADTVSVTATRGGVLNPGDDCTLTCSPSGGNPENYSYRWRFKHVSRDSYQALTGATSADFLLQSAADSDVGTYECIVTNAGGMALGGINISIIC